MKIGIIGSGVVAQTLGTKLIGQGHDLILGTRDPNKLDDKKMFGATLREWKSQTEGRARIATFEEAAAHGELLINATGGQVSVEALKLAAADKVGGRSSSTSRTSSITAKGCRPPCWPARSAAWPSGFRPPSPTSRW